MARHGCDTTGWCRASKPSRHPWCDANRTLVLGLEHKYGSLEHSPTWLNGEPAIATKHDGRLVFTTSVDTDGERLLAFYRVLNPDKLRGLTVRQHLPPDEYWRASARRAR